MDFLTSKIRPMYFKYLTAAFGSALISSIYGVVDMAMVGQYQGPEGTAALAVVSPIWNIIYSLGLLMGIGGSVLFSTLRGESEKNREKSNEYFTYEFGYGKSYTTFDISVDDVQADKDKVTVTATVTNTGDTYSGKEVVEVYFSAPAGELEKPYQELAAYGKTDELAPGQSQTLTLTYNVSEMSSYFHRKGSL